MSRRSRIVGFGSAALLVLAGALGVAVLPGVASDIALGVIGVGFVVALSLVFAEVGFSEDRARAREEAARVRRDDRPRPPVRRARPGLGRMRGHPRRLR